MFDSGVLPETIEPSKAHSPMNAVVVIVNPQNFNDFVENLELIRFPERL